MSFAGSKLHNGLERVNSWEFLPFFGSNLVNALSLADTFDQPFM